MPTILLKKSDTPGSVPGTANLTNLAGGVEVAVNTADKRVYSMTSASAVIELGTNPSSLTLSGGTANGVLYLNGSKVLTSGSALVFDGTTVLTTPRINITNTGIGATFSSSGGSGMRVYGSSGTNQWDVYLNGANIRFSDNTGGGVVKIDTGAVIDGNLGIGTASPSKKLDIRTNVVGESALMLISNDNTSGTGGSPTVASIEFASAGVAKASIAAAVYGNDWLSFRTGSNTERMRLTSSVLSTDSSISVGIGTASPAAKLHVSNGSNSDSGDFTAFVFGGTDATNSRTGSIIKGTSTPYNTIFRYQNNTGTTTGSLIFQNGSTPQATLDSSGNLGLGVTPSAWIDYKALQTTGASFIGYSDGASNNQAQVVANAYFTTGSAWKYIYTDHASRYMQYDGEHRWYTAPSGTINTAISFTQAMTLDANGNLFCGGTTGSSRLNLQTTTNSSTDSNYITLYNAGENVGHINWINGNGDLARITGTKTGAGASANDGILTFSTALDSVLGERGRFTAGGYFKASNTGGYDNATGPYHELLNNDASDAVVLVTHFGATNPLGIGVAFTAASPDDNTQYFLRCADSTTARCFIYSDGDLANHDGVYGTISDERLKQDIVDAPSQWNDLKAVRFRKYRMKTDVEANPDAPALLGVVAQELEQTSPGLIDEHPNEDGTTTKTVKSSILLMKAAVALQEAMARIEQLEAKVAALEAK